MAKRTFVGTAPTVPRVTKGTPGGTIVAGNQFKVTVTDELGNTVVSTTNATGTTVGQTVTDIVAQWATETDPRLTAIQVANQATYVQFTRSDGVPFAISLSTAQGSGGTNLHTFVPATITPGSNAADFNSAANYEEGIVPAAADDITFAAGSLLYGLQQAAVVTGKVNFAATWQGAIGAPGEYFSITPSEFTFSASGAQPAYINVNGAAIAGTVNGTAAPQNGYGLYLLGSAMTTWTFTGGATGIAVGGGETASITTIVNNGATVVLGNAVTNANFNQAAGTGLTNSAVTAAASVSGGTLTSRGTGAILAATVSGKGTFYPNSSGLITTLTRLGGLTDMTQSRVARTVTNDIYTAGAVLRYDPTVVTLTNGSKPLTGSGAVELTAKAAA